MTFKDSISQPTPSLYLHSDNTHFESHRTLATVTEVFRDLP
jgi:hypothetical protein